MPPELAGVGVSVAGFESQCHWPRLQTLVPGQHVQRRHVFLTYHVQGVTPGILCTLTAPQLPASPLKCHHAPGSPSTECVQLPRRYSVSEWQSPVIVVLHSG